LRSRLKRKLPNLHPIAMDLQLNGKLALVTGSTAGIGYSIAKTLAAEGARVIVNGRTQARVDEAAASIRSAHPSAHVETIAADLSRAEAANLLFDQFPDLDILINNLGVYEVKPFENITDQDWMSIIETNFLSGVRLSRHWLPEMKQAGWGRIIFISSESAVNIPTEMIHYGVTKTMQVALARGLAETTAGTSVTVNSVLVGPTRSEGVAEFVTSMAQAKGVSVEEVENEFFATVRPGSLLKRFITTDEVAAIVAFIASPLSSATNGAAIRVDGGVIRTIL
jgi:NAD(P)-dependent dehydrogenase (short-subunit alcohol dehydrogenase family)